MPRHRSDEKAASPRHSAEWYDQDGERVVLRSGERMFIECVGGPCRSRLEVFPPRLEIRERNGTYVLVDVGLRSEWRYEFVPDHGV